MSKYRRKIVLWDVMHKPGGPASSLGVLSTAAGAARCHEVDVCVASAPALPTPDLIAAQAMEGGGDIVGFSVNALNEPLICRTTVLLRRQRPDIVLLAGGPSTPFSRLLADHFDILALGEAEDSVYELAEALAGGRLSNVLDGSLKITGIVSAREWRLGLTGRETNLQAAPSPYAPEDMYLQRLPTNGNRQLFWETTRGCVHHCAFCSYSLLGGQFREIPALRLAREAEYLRNSRVQSLFITDPVLGGTRARAEAILRLLSTIPAKKSVLLRAEYIDENLAYLLSAANVEWLDLGLQTTNPKLQWVRTNDLRRFMIGMHNAQKYGLRTKVDLIFGLPGDSESDMIESMRFVIEEVRPDIIKVFPLKVYPGTEIANRASQLGDPKWLSYDADTLVTRSTFSCPATDLYTLIQFGNATAAAYRFLSARGYFLERPDLRRISVFRNFYQFILGVQDTDFDAWALLNLPQNSYDEFRTARLWTRFLQRMNDFNSFSRTSGSTSD